MVTVTVMALVTMVSCDSSHYGDCGGFGYSGGGAYRIMMTMLTALQLCNMMIAALSATLFR